MIALYPGLDVNIVILLLLGLSVGVLSGFTGVGGGFIATPALIVMGFPANLAVGTSLCWAFLNSIAGYIGHRSLGNTDVKLGIAIALPTLLGVEVGVQLAEGLHSAGLADTVILAVTIFLMVVIGTYTLIESIRRKAYLDGIEEDRSTVLYQPTAFALRLQAIKLKPVVHFARSGITISIWFIILLGLIAGIIIGLTGSGGGFIVVPSLIYLVGVPPIVAVGTALLQVVVSYSYGAIRYFVGGNVVILAALILLVISIFGVMFGTYTTRCVRGVSVRLVLGTTIAVVSAGSLFKLLWLASGRGIPWMELTANIITFTGIGLSMLSVLALFILSRRYISGKRIPSSLESFCQDNRHNNGK